jgi:DNA-binding response OmpR family regulator
VTDLRELYLDSLPPQIEALESAAEALDDGDLSARGSIGRVAHQLKGSGATYGFPEITDRALDVLNADDDRVAGLTRYLISLLAELSSGSPRSTDKILIIDDDPAIQMLIRHTLEAPDREILVASTMLEGRQGLAEDPDLLVLDLILPDADGRELLAKLRRDPATADLTVVVLSGSDSEIARAECLALGANAFLEKPFDTTAFRVLVESLLRTAEITSRTEAVAASPDAAEEPSPARSQSVLLAEDDDLVAALIVDRLGRDGFEMVHCSDGEAALAEARRNPPDLAILDVKMPKMDGFEVLARFREIPELADTAVIVLTAMGSEHDVVRGFDLGADDYVLKPFSPTELAVRVHRLVQQR